jgi:hypothetical protein
MKKIVFLIIILFVFLIMTGCNSKLTDGEIKKLYLSSNENFEGFQIVDFKVLLKTQQNNKCYAKLQIRVESDVVVGVSENIELYMQDYDKGGWQVIDSDDSYDSIKYSFKDDISSDILKKYVSDKSYYAYNDFKDEYKDCIIDMNRIFGKGTSEISFYMTSSYGKEYKCYLDLSLSHKPYISGVYLQK